MKEDELKIIEYQNHKEKKIIGVQVSMEVYDKLKDISLRRFISMSDLIRYVLLKHLDDIENM